MENADIIFTYTRKQAIEDGIQFALTDEAAKMAKDVGYKYPVYMTTGIFELIKNAVNDKKNHNDFNGVMWDILWMSRAHSKYTSETSIEFEVIINGTVCKMWVECGATDPDDPTPCLTFMLPEEY